MGDGHKGGSCCTRQIRLQHIANAYVAELFLLFEDCFWSFLGLVSSYEKLKRCYNGFLMFSKMVAPWIRTQAESPWVQSGTLIIIDNTPNTHPAQCIFSDT